MTSCATNGTKSKILWNRRYRGRSCCRQCFDYLLHTTSLSSSGAIFRLSMHPHTDQPFDATPKSLQAIGLGDVIQMAHHAMSSRVLDAVLESETVPKAAKRKLVMTFLGRYHDLVDDRIGSRVGDRCWAYADPYLKVRSLPSIIPFRIRWTKAGIVSAYVRGNRRRSRGR